MKCYEMFFELHFCEIEQIGQLLLVKHPRQLLVHSKSLGSYNSIQVSSIKVSGIIHRVYTYA